MKQSAKNDASSRFEPGPKTGARAVPAPSGHGAEEQSTSCFAVAALIVLMTVSFFGTSSRGLAASNTTMNAVITANTAFTLDLFERERARPGNLFFSPYSISTALAMTYAGARGQTAEEMARTLHLTLPQTEVPVACSNLVRQIENVNTAKPLRLEIANSVWGQEDFPFLPAFLDLVHRDYAAEAWQVDFVRNAEPARLEINSWVAKKTQDKIPELLQPGQITSDTRMVLCNAIYFKGDWSNKFDPSATHSAPFSTDDGKQVQVPLMTRTFEVRSRPFEELTVFELPYLSNVLSMVVLLPKDREGLPAVERTLNVPQLSGWLSSLASARAIKSEVYLPKFKLDCRLELASTLSALGMPTAFSSKADFSGMSQATKLCIDKVVHQAYVDVNEEGTEAAAATGSTMMLTSAFVRIPVLRVDHPFLFLIRENATGSVLFFGRVVNPLPR
jgi:serpin B